MLTGVKWHTKLD